MATHSRILAWEILGQESLVGYSPCGHKRVRHDLATKQQQQYSFIHPFTHPFILQPNHSFIHPSIYLPIHPFTHQPNQGGTRLSGMPREQNLSRHSLLVSGFVQP